jgi:conjugative relaxase-like TrwC/TraI family protein
MGRLTGPRWSAEYYLAQQAGCPADYYTGSGERRGMWIGSGAAALGLRGDIADEQFRALLAGKSPDGSQQWMSRVLRLDPRAKLPVEPLRDAIRSIGRDPATIAPWLSDRPGRIGEPAAASQSRQRTTLIRADHALALCQGLGLDPTAVFGPALDDALSHLDDRVDVRLPGLDLTFSAPKSVSVLYGLGSDEVAAQVRAGHEAAVAAALGYLERTAGHALRGHQGDGATARRVPTQGFIAAAFGHRSNRCGDPQLHTHVVVANMLLDESGRPSALDSRELYRQAKTAGFLYQAALRHELTSRLGVSWTAVTRGHAEILGVPDSLRTLFSKRRHQIEAVLAASGQDGARAAQLATLATRPPKSTAADTPTLRQRWAAEARSIGGAPAALNACLDRAETIAPLDTAELAAGLLSPAGLTHESSSFDRRDVVRGVAESLQHGATVEQIEAMADGALGDPAVIPLLAAGPDRRFSTADLLSVEERGLALATQTKAVHSLDDADVDLALTGHPCLTSGQRDAVARMLSSTSAVNVVIGRAGAGKTTALAVANIAWQQAGVRVIGTAVAASTAQRLEAATGIRSMSLARLLQDARLIDPATGTPCGLPAGGVVVVDEAAMVGTRAFTELLQHASASNTKVVAVGDPHQLPSIEAGGMFAALVQSLGAVELGENLRQDAAWERDALDDIRAGDITSGVRAYLDHDRIHTATTAAELCAQMVDDWWRQRQTGQPVTMLAVRRFDVATLNDAARARLVLAGEIEGPELVVDDATLGVRRFAVGDDVIVTRNTYRLGLLNGTRAHVIDVQPTTASLTVCDDAGRDHELPAGLVADRLAHAYAITCHKAQGITVDTALLYGTGALTREAGYVGLSRGRRENHLYAVAEDLDRTLATGLAVSETDDLPQHRDPGHDAELLPSLIDRLEVSRAKTLAIAALQSGQPERAQRVIEM